MRALFIVHVLATPILLGAALLVMSERTGRILNFIDYKRVTNVVALHRWAGIRLLFLSLISAVSGVASWLLPKHALVFLLCFVAAMLLVVGVIVAGSSKFSASQIP
jgi:hypothetical protein